MKKQRLILLLLSIVILVGCKNNQLVALFSNEKVIPHQTITSEKFIQKNNSQANGTLLSFTIPSDIFSKTENDITHIRLSINLNGNPLPYFDHTPIKIHKIGNTYASESFFLPSGDISIFKLVFENHANQVLFAIPQKGSKLAHLINPKHSLPWNIISKNNHEKTIKIKEILNIKKGLTLENFGYTSKKKERYQYINFPVYIKQNSTSESIENLPYELELTLDHSDQKQILPITMDKNKKILAITIPIKYDQHTRNNADKNYIFSLKSSNFYTKKIKLSIKDILEKDSLTLNLIENPSKTKKITLPILLSSTTDLKGSINVKTRFANLSSSEITSFKISPSGNIDIPLNLPQKFWRKESNLNLKLVIKKKGYASVKKDIPIAKIYQIYQSASPLLIELTPLPDIKLHLTSIKTSGSEIILKWTNQSKQKLSDGTFQIIKNGISLRTVATPISIFKDTTVVAGKLEEYKLLFRRSSDNKTFISNTIQVLAAQVITEDLLKMNNAIQCFSDHFIVTNKNNNLKIDSKNAYYFNIDHLPKNIAIIIHDGVQVIFKKKLNVNGKIKFLGSKKSPVIVKSLDKNQKLKKKITLHFSENSSMSNTHFEHIDGLIYLSGEAHPNKERTLPYIRGLSTLEINQSLGILKIERTTEWDGFGTKNLHYIPNKENTKQAYGFRISSNAIATELLSDITISTLPQTNQMPNLELYLEKSISRVTLSRLIFTKKESNNLDLTIYNQSDNLSLTITESTFNNLVLISNHNFQQNKLTINESKFETLNADATQFYATYSVIKTGLYIRSNTFQKIEPDPLYYIDINHCIIGENATNLPSLGLGYPDYPEKKINLINNKIYIPKNTLICVAGSLKEPVSLASNIIFVSKNQLRNIPTKSFMSENFKIKDILIKERKKW